MDRSRACRCRLVTSVVGGQAMMQRARRASLFVIFYLLTSAATAYAECAWVLWSNATLSSGSDYWGIIVAYAREDGGKAACDRSQEMANKRERARKSDRSYFCLPDTL